MHALHSKNLFILYLEVVPLDYLYLLPPYLLTSGNYQSVLFLWIWFVQILHVSKIIQYLSSSLWLSLLSIMPSKFIHVVINWRISFLWIKNMLDAVCACSVMSDSATTWIVAHQASLSMRFSRPRDHICISGISCIDKWILYHQCHQFSSVQLLSCVRLFPTHQHHHSHPKQGPQGHKESHTAQVTQHTHISSRQ